MTTRTFTLARYGELQALFQTATLNLNASKQHVRDLAAQLDAELYLAKLFGERQGIRPQ
jgi:hypothetical protein